ncbi:TasA family protein [Halococcus qingdaonensis]|uniref:TasA family protein n=1 Tax=Halococcus qingdaonensis TaxID=224402 RepID=UPI00211677E3|nr:TasA family protein [Halococcus qingdaonensis]
MTDETTRRRVLTAIATAGGIGALGGAGTYAVFSDTASTKATFTSGSLDLRVHYDRTYVGTEEQTDSGTIDGQESTELPGYSNLMAGDSGQLKFCFELAKNSAYLWTCGELTTSSDLADAIEATVRYCDQDGTKGNPIGEQNRSLSSVFSALNDGVPLDYKGRDRDAGKQTAYEPSSSGETIGPCLCIDWKLPDDTDATVQNKEFGFNLRFHAMQARHHDGTNNPCTGD